jgi:predicted membrane GTPase involved in stress response
VEFIEDDELVEITPKSIRCASATSRKAIASALVADPGSRGF